MSLSIKEQIDEYFKTQEKADKEILNQITLYIYYIDSKNTNSDLFILARLLPSEFLYKIISYYDGDTMEIPSKEDFKKSFITSVCFYLKEIKGWDWTQIKDFFPKNEEYIELLSSISIGKKINKIKEELGQNIMKLFKNLDTDKIKKFHEDVFNE